MAPASHISVTLVQPDVQWEDKAANLQHLESLLQGLAPTDLIVLPEMFSTGFSMRPAELAEPTDGPTREWMHALAQEHQCVVTGSIIAEEDGAYYNRLIWMTPQGDVKTYDKRHLFSFANEHDHYSSGNKRLITDLKGWRVCPLICYDLRFPVWNRNQDLEGGEVDSVFDLQLFVANWPEARRAPWMTLLEARAHENQCYVVGVNRVGDDGNGIAHSGDSAAYDPKGVKLTDVPAGKEHVTTVRLSYEDLTTFRAKFTAWKDKDRFRLL